MQELNDFIKNIKRSDKRTIAKAITSIENNVEERKNIVDNLFKLCGNAWIIGITGAAGAGKSSFINQLIFEFRKENKKVAVIAVDPSSPITNGSILGDRIRMSKHFLDENVFIRSMSSRGHLGGLSVYTVDTSIVLDAAGFDIIIVETVGVGQSEVEIVNMADTTIVCEAPGMGDDIQAIKAGIMEIADIFVVNKSDRPETDRTIRFIEAVLDQSMLDWRPPVQKCNSLVGTGINDIIRKIYKHKEYLENTGKIDEIRKIRIKHQIDEAVIDEFKKRTEAIIHNNKEYTNNYNKVFKKECSPYELADKICDLLNLSEWRNI